MQFNRCICNMTCYTYVKMWDIYDVNVGGTDVSSSAWQTADRRRQIITADSLSHLFLWYTRHVTCCREKLTLHLLTPVLTPCYTTTGKPSFNRLTMSFLFWFYKSYNATCSLNNINAGKFAKMFFVNLRGNILLSVLKSGWKRANNILSFVFSGHFFPDH
jgi:hypothetical protein